MLWARRFDDASEAQWKSFAEKLQKRKGKRHQGADEYYVLGIRPADLSASARQRVSQSEPVLPGGMQFQKATLELVGAERGDRRA